MCSTLKRRPGSPSSFLLALLITPPWRSLEAPCVMLLDSLFTQLSVSRQLIFTVLNAKYVHPRPALLTDPFYKCNVITNVKNSCREITTTYLSAGHIESEAAGWKSGRLHCSLPRSDKSSSRSRLCWLRNNYYFPFASLRGNMTKCLTSPFHVHFLTCFYLDLVKHFIPTFSKVAFSVGHNLGAPLPIHSESCCLLLIGVGVDN